MIGSVSSGAALQLNTAGMAPHKSNGGGAKLDLNSVPESKVKVSAPHTEGKGLKIDIKV
ncbi:MAG: hypothetical protein HWE25_06845 [Alphaproteobacteria bacterium]|nr:hypothetical protein [Alphaproteobacteria bacterium]